MVKRVFALVKSVYFILDCGGRWEKERKIKLDITPNKFNILPPSPPKILHYMRECMGTSFI